MSANRIVDPEGRFHRAPAVRRSSCGRRLGREHGGAAFVRQRTLSWFAVQAGCARHVGQSSGGRADRRLNTARRVPRRALPEQYEATLENARATWRTCRFAGPFTAGRISRSCNRAAPAHVEVPRVQSRKRVTQREPHALDGPLNFSSVNPQRIPEPFFRVGIAG